MEHRHCAGLKLSWSLSEWRYQLYLGKNYHLSLGMLRKQINAKNAEATLFSLWIQSRLLTNAIN
jgi:hypothetical protein